MTLLRNKSHKCVDNNHITINSFARTLDSILGHLKYRVLFSLENSNEKIEISSAANLLSALMHNGRVWVQSQAENKQEATIRSLDKNSYCISSNAIQPLLVMPLQPGHNFDHTIKRPQVIHFNKVSRL